MTEAEERAVTQIVIGWIIEYRGAETASIWAWECTPMPMGFPSSEQLDEGVRIATGELSVDVLRARYDDDMSAVLREWDAKTNDETALALA